MPSAYSPYLLIIVLMVCSVLFAITPLALAWSWARRFSPRKPGKDKNAIYECGLESKGDAWVQFKSEYYLYAIIFLIFDVETIFYCRLRFLSPAWAQERLLEWLY